MSSLLKMTEKVPIVVILGATGAGKSKLALQLAHHFGGEIISSDAMQMYKGLDIVTNKVTAEEQALVKHHMIDFLDPLATNNVVDFRNKALPIVESLLREGKIPFICGGTNYYIESLLWKILIDEDTPLLTNAEGVVKKRKLGGNDNGGEENKKKYFKLTDTGSEETQVDWNCVDFSVEKELENVSTRVLYEKLQSVDSERAECLHPNERRKICRSLQIYQKYGICHSKLLEEQKAENGSSLGGGLRFPADKICIIEVWSQPDILTERCNKRVDKMIEMGMVEELEDFHENCNKTRINQFNPQDLEGAYTAGIFQSIGFKEFHPYLILSDQERKTPTGEELFKKGVEYLKIVTRQYAKRQKNWMNRRFLMDERNPPSVYRVDSSEPSAWKDDVYEPAKDIVTAFIEARTPEATPLERKMSQGSSDQDLRKTFHCDVCQRDLKGERQYREHLKGNKHKKVQRLKGLDKIIVNKYVLVLESFEEENKPKAVKELKDVFELGNVEILELLKSLPCEIGSAMGERKANKIVNKFKTVNVVLGIKTITE